MRFYTPLFLWFSACYTAKWTANIRGVFYCKGLRYKIGRYYMLEQSGKGPRVIANSASNSDGIIDITGTAKTGKKPHMSIAFFHGCGAPTAIPGPVCKSYRQLYANITYVSKGNTVAHPYNFGFVDLIVGGNFTCHEQTFFDDYFTK